MAWAKQPEAEAYFKNTSILWMKCRDFIGELVTENRAVYLRLESAMEMLIERFRIKCLQLHHAIRHGDDLIVLALDREIEPLISQIIAFRADNSKDMRVQLQLICDLIREDAGDKSSVLRHTAILTTLFNRYLVNGAASPLVENIMQADSNPLSSGSADDASFHQSLIDAIPDRVLAVTQDHRVIYANIAAARHYARHSIEMVGLHVKEFVGCETLGRAIIAGLATCFADGSRIVNIVGRTALIGRSCVQTTIRAAQTSPVSVVMLVIQDAPIGSP